MHLIVTACSHPHAHPMYMYIHTRAHTHTRHATKSWAGPENKASLQYVYMYLHVGTRLATCMVWFEWNLAAGAVLEGLGRN